MPLGYSTQQNFRKIPVLGLVMESGASAPTSPVNGQLWYDTVNNKAKVYENGSWLDVYSTAAAGGPAGGDLSGTYPNPQIASGVIVVADTATSFDLGALATAHPTTTDVALNGKKITAVADPAAGTDAANKQYVDGVAQGLDTKGSVRAASLGNLTLSGTQTVDGVALVAGDRCLVKNQTSQPQNGIYVVAAGAWTRATDMDAAAEVPAAYTFVEEGTQADSGWVCVTDAPVTLNTTNIVWQQFSGAGQITSGNGLTKTGNTLDVGAGTGITVGADTVSLDTTYTDGRYALVAAGAKRYAADVGALSAGTPLTITHNLNTLDVQVTVFNKSTGDEEQFTITHNAVNTITITSDLAYTANTFRVVVGG